MSQPIKIRRLVLLLALSLASFGAGAEGGTPGERMTKPVGDLQPVSDSTLDSMRGRFITGAGQILYFGVEMLSTWRSSDGRVLSGSALLSFDFSKGMPQVTFVPTVSIVQGSGGALVDTAGRSIDASGLANVSGIAQGIQIVGDHNSAGNSTELHVTTTLPAGAGAGVAGNAALAVGDASVSASLQPDSMAVTLGVDGQGSLRQTIRGDGAGGGSVLQTVSLLGDGHDVGNQLRITLVQPGAGSAALQLQQNVALSLGLLQGLRSGR